MKKLFKSALFIIISCICIISLVSCGKGIKRDEAKSLINDFFAAIVDEGYVIKPGTVLTLDKLFAATNTEKDDIQDFYVYASVTPVDSEISARGTFTKVDNRDWTKSTIAFSGEGKLRITISDYYFCELTTINVTVGEQKPVEVEAPKAEEKPAKAAPKGTK